MMKNPNLARSVGEMGWNEFNQMLDRRAAPLRQRSCSEQGQKRCSEY